MINLSHNAEGGELIVTVLNDRQYQLLQTKLKEDNGCLVFTGTPRKDGYGQFCHIIVHVAYWTYNNGPVPSGLELAHSCSNRLCVRHVRPLTHKENVREIWLHNMCKKGHMFTPDNTYTAPNGTRACRKCRLATNRARNARYYASRS